MPRTARASVGGLCYHVLNRGNARSRVFHDAADADWVQWVNQPQTEQELAALRRSVNRGTPLGAEAWTRRIARRVGLEFTLRPPGRPRNKAKK